MSVYIKSMDMPKSCEDCFCYRHNAEYDYAYCNISSVKVLGNANARLNNCPLIPVPDHGGLVDLKAPFCAQYYDEMTEEWVEKEVTVEDVLLGSMVCDMPPVVIPADKEEET